MTGATQWGTPSPPTRYKQSDVMAASYVQRTQGGETQESFELQQPEFMTVLGPAKAPCPRPQGCWSSQVLAAKPAVLGVPGCSAATRFTFSLLILIPLHPPCTPHSTSKPC